MENKRKEYSVGVVILNYSTYQDTMNLVDALQKQSVAEEMFIVVVDNYSPNESYRELKILENRYKTVKVIETVENLGYAKGNNVGLKYLEKHIEPEYVAVLNNDLVLPDNCFERLIDRYQELDRPGVIAPIMLNLEGVRQIPYKINTYWDDLFQLSLLFRYLITNLSKTKEIDDTGKNAMKVDMIPGSFMFISFEFFKAIDYFYPSTFLYVEERFMAHKIKEKGLQNYILLDESYVHAHSQTIDKFHNLHKKYSMLYDGWYLYHRDCNKCGILKLLLLKGLSKLSVIEWWGIGLIKQYKNA